LLKNRKFSQKSKYFSKIEIIYFSFSPANIYLSAHRASQSADSGVFGTRRKASNILERWPKELNYELVKAIEHGCKDIMEIFGYKFIGSDKEYKNKQKSYLPELDLKSDLDYNSTEHIK